MSEWMIQAGSEPLEVAGLHLVEEVGPVDDPADTAARASQAADTLAASVEDAKNMITILGEACQETGVYATPDPAAAQAFGLMVDVHASVLRVLTAVADQLGAQHVALDELAESLSVEHATRTPAAPLSLIGGAA